VLTDCVSPQTIVTCNQYPKFRSPRNFHCPKEFIPERFMSSAHSEDFANDSRAAFQPFELECHSCIGQILACVEMRLIGQAFLYLRRWTCGCRGCMGVGNSRDVHLLGEKATECASESFEPLILRWYGPYEDFLFAHIAQCLWLLYALVFLPGEGICCRPGLSDCASGDFHSA